MDLPNGAGVNVLVGARGRTLLRCSGRKAGDGRRHSKPMRNSGKVDPLGEPGQFYFFFSNWTSLPR